MNINESPSRLFARLGRIPLLAVALAVTVLTGCDESAPEAEANNEASRPRPVRMETVEAAIQQVTHRYSGRVQAVQTVNLSFRVGGKLTELPIKEGQVVKKGALIARLDPADYERAVREAEVNLNLATKEFDRAKQLKSDGVVSAKTLDERRANRDLATVALDNAKQNLAYTRLTAPFDALVTRRLIDNFTNVNVGTEIVRIQDVTEIRIAVDIPETVFATVSRKDVRGIWAEFEAASGVRFPLTYREHVSEPNEVTQTYSVTLAMPRPENLTILPGMTASVFLRVEKATGIGPTPVSVPVAAVAVDQDKAFYVWVVDQNTNIVEKRIVKVGPIGDDSIPVLSGLEPGETIVTAGVDKLQDGMTVRPAKTQE